MRKVWINKNEGHFPALYITTNPFIFYFVVRIFKKPLRITLKRKAR